MLRSDISDKGFLGLGKQVRSGGLSWCIRATQVQNGPLDVYPVPSFAPSFTRRLLACVPGYSIQHSWRLSISRCGRNRSICRSAGGPNVRGRDAHCWAPPAQIRASAILRTRLPPRMFDVEALTGPGMLDAGPRKPDASELPGPFPRQGGLLAAARQRALPEDRDLGAERRECPAVAGHGVIGEETRRNLLKPMSLFGD